MPAKKPAAKKATRGKKRVGLTSAIGPKATTALVIFVMAGGIAVAARQQQQQMKAKDSAAVMASDGPGDTAVGASKRPSTAVVSTAISNVAVAPASKSTASASASRPVTVVGCLEKSGDGFRLRDTEGTAAPKSRSWKSGFLKKGTTSVDVVDGSHALSLGGEVGHRVSLTGSLTDREMRAQSFHRVAASCKGN